MKTIEEFLTPWLKDITEDWIAAVLFTAGMILLILWILGLLGII